MCLFCRLELCFDVRVIIFLSSYWLLTVCFVIWFKIVVFSLNVFHYYCLFHLLKCIYSCRFKSIVAWFFSQYYVFDNAMMAKIFTRINKLLNWNMLFLKFFFIKQYFFDYWTSFFLKWFGEKNLFWHGGKNWLQPWPKELFRILKMTSSYTRHAQWSRSLIWFEIVSCPLICHNLIFNLFTLNKGLLKMLIHINSTSSWKQVATKLYLFDCWTNYLLNGSEKITLLTPSKKIY